MAIFKLPTFDIFIAEEFSRFLLIMAVACAFKTSLDCDQQSLKTQLSTSFRVYTVNTALIRIKENSVWIQNKAGQCKTNRRLDNFWALRHVTTSWFCPLYRLQLQLKTNWVGCFTTPNVTRREKYAPLIGSFLWQQFPANWPFAVIGCRIAYFWEALLFSFALTLTMHGLIFFRIGNWSTYPMQYLISHRQHDCAP